MKKIGGMFEQAQQMQQEFQRLQESVAKKTVEATAGGGMVKVVANGKNEILSITLDPEIMKMNDKDMLQDLVTAGVNEALKAAQQMANDEMKGLLGNLGPLSSMLKM